MLTAFWLYLLVSIASANGQVKVPIAVIHSGDDLVGKQYSFEVREAIRRSAAYELTGTDQSAFQLRIVTLDPDSSNEARKGCRMAAAVTVTVTNYIPYEKNNPQTVLSMFLTQTVETCGSNVLADCAKSTTAVLDEQVEHYKRLAGR